MRNLVFILVLLPQLAIGQFTYVPDDAFEQRLINLGLDDMLDDNVLTSVIDTVEVLYLNNKGITDLTGIEDFVMLRDLFCHDNQIVNLDLRNNTILLELNCNNNMLTSLDVRNGNNFGLWYFTATNNPQLYCIVVNDVSYAYTNWLKDSGCAFSDNCSISTVEDYSTKRKLIKILDVFGISVIPKPNMTLFYIYNDGTTEKKLIIK